MVASETELRSVGQLAADLQTDPRVIRRVLGEHDIRPALSLNGRCFYDAAAVALIRDALAGVAAEVTTS